jgi:hypothetical protein
MASALEASYGELLRVSKDAFEALCHYELSDVDQRIAGELIDAVEGVKFEEALEVEDAAS